MVLGGMFVEEVGISFLACLCFACIIRFVAEICLILEYPRRKLIAKTRGNRDNKLKISLIYPYYITVVLRLKKAGVSSSMRRAGEVNQSTSAQIPVRSEVSESKQSSYPLYTLSPYQIHLPLPTDRPIDR